MTFSKSVRLIFIVCAALWLAAPLWAAPSDRGRLLQEVSPLDSPPPSSLDLFPTPAPDPALCTSTTPCPEGTPTPVAQVFLPGLAGSAGSASDQPPAPPLDLGTTLNYVALGVIMIGVALKAIWFVADRRKGE